jgi:hypothetical protein
MPQVTLDKINKDASGRVRFLFGKSELEFPTIEAAREWARQQLLKEQLQAIAVALCLTRQPNLHNLNALEGRTVNVDFTLANWGTVS